MQTIDININDFKILCERRGHNFDSAKNCIVKTSGDIIYADVNHPSYPNPTQAIEVTVERRRIEERAKKAISDIGVGAGTELKKLLSWLNFTATENCSCNKRAKRMNDMGIQWCKDHQDLIHDWLKEEAYNRKLPFISYIAKKVISMAIKRAENNIK